MNSTRTAKDYLNLPYARIVIPNAEGGYRAELLEFPGCYADGETPDEAYKNLEEAAESWIESCLANNKAIPEPTSSLTFGGNILLRLPRTIHRQAVKLATRDRTSLNQYLLSAVSARVGAEELYERIAERFEARLVSSLSAAIYAWQQRAVTPRNVETAIRIDSLNEVADNESGAQELLNIGR